MTALAWSRSARPRARAGGSACADNGRSSTPAAGYGSLYVRANLCQDWGTGATTSFDGVPVPLKQQATGLDLAAGLTVRLTQNLSLYAQGGYQFAVATLTMSGATASE
jgi:outer membrane autotransporter protein